MANQLPGMMTVSNIPETLSDTKIDIEFGCRKSCCPPKVRNPKSPCAKGACACIGMPRCPPCRPPALCGPLACPPKCLTAQPVKKCPPKCCPRPCAPRRCQSQPPVRCPPPAPAAAFDCPPGRVPPLFVCCNNPLTKRAPIIMPRMPQQRPSPAVFNPRFPPGALPSLPVVGYTSPPVLPAPAIKRDPECDRSACPSKPCAKGTKAAEPCPPASPKS